MAHRRLIKADAEWRAELSEEEFHVLRLKGTEAPGSGEYDAFYPEEGYFQCKGCGNPLYSAESKFKSGCGWPAFDKCFRGALKTEIDVKFGMRRIEIMCAACDGHLGHVFEGEGFTKTDERHCVNSICVRFCKDPIPAGLEEAKCVLDGKAVNEVDAGEEAVLAAYIARRDARQQQGG